MRLNFPPLYVILDASLLQTSALAFAQAMSQAGVELLQYRNKAATARQLFDVSQLLTRALHIPAQSAPPSLPTPLSHNPALSQPRTGPSSPVTPSSPAAPSPAPGAPCLAQPNVGFLGPTTARDQERHHAQGFTPNEPAAPSLHPGPRIRYIVNDRPDVALLARAGGVHVGQHDLTVEQTRNIVGSECWVGVSTHTLQQVEAADRTSADYIAFGPVFLTATKQNPDAIVGLELLAQARARTSKPLVAIGGITLELAPSVWRAGADSVAVARDLLRAPDPAARAQAFLAASRLA